ncbi:hypothetical protein K438DRAFT_1822412 [Mycena galopus ATCC 62051]|nr:hypothetical protein K438DRAFT_1822412 [Mycena galopus ATCC 62051]
MSRLSMRMVPASHDRARCWRRRHPASSWSCLCSSILCIRHINFDHVTPSSFNRHAMAALADMGTLKVHCIACACARSPSGGGCL